MPRPAPSHVGRCRHFRLQVHVIFPTSILIRATHCSVTYIGAVEIRKTSLNRSVSGSYLTKCIGYSCTSVIDWWLARVTLFSVRSSYANDCYPPQNAGNIWHQSGLYFSGFHFEVGRVVLDQQPHPKLRAPSSTEARQRWICCICQILHKTKSQMPVWANEAHRRAIDPAGTPSDNPSRVLLIIAWWAVVNEQSWLYPPSHFLRCRVNCSTAPVPCSRQLLPRDWEDQSNIRSKRP